MCPRCATWPTYTRARAGWWKRRRSCGARSTRGTRRPGRRPSNMRRLVFALLLVVSAGCSRRGTGHDFVAPHYPDGPAGLKQLWSDVLDAAHKDEREHVHDLLATTILSDGELRRLLGPKADPLLPRYHQLMAAMVNRGAIELVGQIYEHKYDTIDSFADETDAAVAGALVEPHPLWSVRVRKA